MGDVHPELARLATAVADEASRTQWIDACVVFGSAALSRLGPHSDVDVGWVGAGVDVAREAEFRRGLQRRLTRDLHLVDLERAGILLRIAAVREGAVVFQRQPESWTRFAARSIAEWLDFLPLVQRCAAGVRQAILDTGRRDG